MRLQQLLHTARDYVDNEHIVLVFIVVLIFLDLFVHFFVHFFVLLFVHIDDPGECDDHYNQLHYNHYRASDLLRRNARRRVFIQLPAAMLRIRSRPIKSAVLPERSILFGRWRDMRGKSDAYAYSNTDTNTYTDAYAYSNTDTNTYTDAHTYSKPRMSLAVLCRRRHNLRSCMRHS
jgi:hypothetical protein